MANEAWRVTWAHCCWSRTCPQVIAYGWASMAPADASLGAGAWAGASVSSPPQAPISTAAATSAASGVVLPLSELIRVPPRRGPSGDRPGDARCRDPGSLGGLCDRLARGSVEQVEAGLVLWHEDRAHVAHGGPRLGDLGRRAAHARLDVVEQRRRRCVGLQQIAAHAADATAAAGRRIVGRSLQFARAHALRERGPGVDPELAVDARELRVDGLRRHEQRCGDLLVRASVDD